MTGKAKYVTTSWESLGSLTVEGGARLSMVSFDAVADAGPTVMRVEFPPHYEVPPHSHGSDYCEVILEGSERVGSQEFAAGDVRLVRKGTPYGPVVAGPSGCVAMIVFADEKWKATPVKASDADQLRAAEIEEHVLAEREARRT
jgi:hypothetical protein